MLTALSRLDDAALAAIADLDRRVVAADGGRLKLEYGVLRHRDGAHVEDLLWWNGDRLVGFLGLYVFGSDPELAGMVDPQQRRRGIGTELLRTAAGLLVERGHGHALLVTPRTTTAGVTFASAHGGVHHHSEHYLVLEGTPEPGDRHRDVVVREATDDDVAALRRLLAAGFGEEEDEDDGLAELMRAPEQRQLVVSQDGALVGCLRLSGGAERTGIFGFVVDPALQGQGIGRAVLQRVCADLRAAGVRKVTLEVEVDNDAALGLYTSIGFVQQVTEDYYRVDLGAVVHR
jgi:ribosomal protein S18 acetylase RimI-like enzyme